MCEMGERNEACWEILEKYKPEEAVVYLFSLSSWDFERLDQWYFHVPDWIKASWCYK